MEPSLTSCNIDDLVKPRPGRPGSERPNSDGEQKQRLACAMAREIHERGYGAVTIEQIALRASASKTTFYRHFDDKRECFAYGMAFCGERLLDAVSTTLQRESSSTTGLNRTLKTYVRTISMAPDFAFSYLIEIASAGPEALALRGKYLKRFASEIASWHSTLGDALPEGARALSDPEAQMLAVTIHECVCARAFACGIETLEDYVPELERVVGALTVGMFELQ